MGLPGNDPGFAGKGVITELMLNIFLPRKWDVIGLK